MMLLIVEDDPELNRNIVGALSAEGSDVESVFDGSLAERLLQRERYDCVVMDLNLPANTGVETR